MEGDIQMEFAARIERCLEAAMKHAEARDAPPKLIAAMRHAVFPAGARVRPSLCLAVAGACGDDAPALADAAAAATELLHCASLVHDDLPCFDDADTRRKRPSVHAAFGEPLAILAGDALIVLAFQTVVNAADEHPRRALAVHSALTRGVGMPSGIVAGQAWESEPQVPGDLYRNSKTGALFEAAAISGAIASGADPSAWRPLGERLGEAYQVADDLLDAMARADDSDKPVGRDAVLGRPNAVAELGLAGAIEKLESLIAAVAASVPQCRGAAELRELVKMQAARLVPKKLLRSAA